MSLAMGSSGMQPRPCRLGGWDSHTEHSGGRHTSATVKSNFGVVKSEYLDASERALPLVESASRAVRAVNEADLRDLNCVVSPTEMVRVVCECVMLLTKTVPLEGACWADVKNIVANHLFFSSLLELDMCGISEEQVRFLRELLDTVGSHPLDWRGVCKAAVALLMWVTSVVSYHDLVVARMRRWCLGDCHPEAKSAQEQSAWNTVTFPAGDVPMKPAVLCGRPVVAMMLGETSVAPLRERGTVVHNDQNNFNAAYNSAVPFSPCLSGDAVCNRTRCPRCRFKRSSFEKELKVRHVEAPELQSKASLPPIKPLEPSDRQDRKRRVRRDAENIVASRSDSERKPVEMRDPPACISVPSKPSCRSPDQRRRTAVTKMEEDTAEDPSWEFALKNEPKTADPAAQSGDSAARPSSRSCSGDVLCCRTRCPRCRFATSSCTKDPKVGVAAKSMEALKLKDFYSLRLLSTPPFSVQYVLEAVMHLLAGEVGIDLDVGGGAKDTSWRSAAKLLGHPQFLQHLSTLKRRIDRGSVPRNNIEKARAVQELLGPRFSPVVVAETSAPVGGLCAWVIGTVAYYDFITSV